MTTSTAKFAIADLSIRVPVWQIVVVLLLPLLYMANARMPWSQGLWGEQDTTYYYAFWLSILTIYAISACIVFYFMRRSRVTMSDIGFHARRRSCVTMAVVLLMLGVSAVGFRIFVPYESADGVGIPAGWPTNTLERFFWIPIYLCAGFFEELVYRGFAISALRGKGIPTWLVVLITSVAFSLIHGGVGWILASITFLLGIIFALIYLWRKNLALVMFIHALGDWVFLVIP